MRSRFLHVLFVVRHIWRRITMGKIKRKKEKKEKKGRGPKTGAVYGVKTDVGFEDVNDDGIADLVIRHSAAIDGLEIQRSELVWICLDMDIQAEFEAIVVKNGIEDFEGTFATWRELVHYWKRFTKTLKDLNDLGDKKADQLQEPQIA